MSNGRIVRYTADELRALRAAAGPHDWTRFDSITNEELERLVAEDPDEAGFENAVLLTDEEVRQALLGIEPELLALLPPEGRARSAEVNRIVIKHLERRQARARKAS
jgi:hypothetical protein